MEVTIVTSGTGKTLTSFNVTESTTIGDLKKLYQRENGKYYPERQCYKSEPKGKVLKDEETLGRLNLGTKGTLYFRDLGPQIGWTTVFLTEYAGPLVIYLLFYIRPEVIYGHLEQDVSRDTVVYLAAACWISHYAKRLLETLFIHRFSHATMPIMNIIRNSTYYWGFAALVAYFVNHPLYSPPSYGYVQIYGGLALFIIAEFGNYSIHVAFKNMRPPGTKVRKIPMPNGNPFTQLFRFVSCPNYTYEVLAWAAFSVMTQTLPAAIFTICGFYQMMVWAIAKHKNYKKEFPSYPKGRKSIVPFII